VEGLLPNICLCHCSCHQACLARQA
jgi:hypothetical protein